MQTIFLKDGTQANLIAKTDKGYVVDPLEIYTDYETKEEYAEPSGNVRMVDKVYEVAPIEIIQQEYKEILDKVEAQEIILEERCKELRQIEYDISRIKSTKTDIGRYIINREELRTAKRLILFVRGHVLPRIMDGQKSHKFSVNYEISQYKGEERCWAYSLYSENRDNNWGGSDYFDEGYGIKVDLTDEEIKTLTLERLSKMKASDIHEQNLLSCPDEWLTPELAQTKKEKKERNERSELQRAEKELAAAQEKFDKLSKKELAVS